MKCKAGLCPAYVLPIEFESDQPQDLPPKGRNGSVTEGKYPLPRVFMWILHTLTSPAVFEKG